MRFPCTIRCIMHPTRAATMAAAAAVNVAEERRCYGFQQDHTPEGNYLITVVLPYSGRPLPPTPTRDQLTAGKYIVLFYNWDAERRCFDTRVGSPLYKIRVNPCSGGAAGNDVTLEAKISRVTLTMLRIKYRNNILKDVVSIVYDLMHQCYYAIHMGRDLYVESTSVHFPSFCTNGTRAHEKAKSYMIGHCCIVPVSDSREKAAEMRRNWICFSCNVRHPIGADCGIKEAPVSLWCDDEW